MNGSISVHLLWCVCVCVSDCSVYSELLSLGLLQPFDSIVEGLKASEGSRNYVSPLGMSSLVKHFLSESGTPTCQVSPGDSPAER